MHSIHPFLLTLLSLIYPGSVDRAHQAHSAVKTGGLLVPVEVVRERGDVGVGMDFRLPVQFQERMQPIMIRDVPGKGQLKLQQA